MSEQNLISSVVENIAKYNSSPAMLQRDALEIIKNVLGNDNGIISAENPVALCLEMSAMQTAGSIGKNWILNRRQYPISAQTHEDLYYHLSDLDWVGVFALPAKAKISISFEYEEILQILKPLPDGTGNLLRLPRGFRVVVGGVGFMLDYPVNILQLKHGGFRITYDTTEKSPVQTLSTNVVKHSVSSIYRDTKRLTLELEMIQAEEIEFFDNITANQNITLTKSFNDFYYYARVFHGNDVDGYQEMATTHCPDIYDVTKPTAVLKLIENTDDYTLNVTIPKIYNYETSSQSSMQVTSSLGGRIKVLAYCTLGQIDMNLGSYTIDQYKYDFFPSGKTNRNYDKLGEYSTALSSLRSVIIFSNEYVNQGRDPLTFLQLRERVINNTIGPNDIPISHTAITDKAQDDGFKIIRAVDYVTNRAYWAIRSMPKPDEDDLITPAAASIETLTTSISDLVGTGTVKNNGDRITITPNSIFSMSNGKMSILDQTEITNILNMSVENRAKEINSRELFYTPFHYVVDNENDTVKLRAYHLDYPEILGKYYNDGNNKITTSLSIHTPYIIIRTEKGYKIRLEMKSNSEYKKLPDNRLWAQLLIHPYDDKGYTYILGNLVGRNKDDEPIFEFDIETNFDVDDNHCLIINNSSLNGTSNLDIPIELDNNFEFLFGFYGEFENWSKVTLDNKIGTHLLEENAKVILSESLHVRLGYHLRWLWTRARTYAGDVTYARYSTDVPMTYEEDVYDKDPSTGSILNVVNGKVVYNLVHPKGTKVTDKSGNVVYKHRQGDVVLDSNGQPVIQEPRKITRRLELMVIDATYWFATDDIATNYRNELVRMFIDWLVYDLGPLNDKTLEQTGIYFYPSATMGQLKVMYNEGIETYIDAAQSIQVNLTVSRQVFNNFDVLEKIKETTIKVLNEEIGKETVSISTIVAKLVNEHGDDVIGLTINNLGNNDKIISFTVLDEGKRATIRKKLNVNSDETLSVVEDVTFNFNVHSTEDEKIKSL